MATIKDVAVKANVSIKTVSRVINGERGVASSTRQHVQTVIRELNYVPNLSAQRLKRGKSALLGLVLPRVDSPYAIKLFRNILAEARKRGYFVLVLEQEPGETQSRKALERAIQNHRIEGLIIAPPGGENTALLTFLRQNNIPYLVISPNSPAEHVLSVDTTDRLGAFEATHYLISLGHTRIAHITCLPTERFSQERLAGYQAALQEAGLPAQSQTVCRGNNSIESGYSAAHELFKLPQPPTAIFAGNDEMAVGVILAAFELGVRVPDELSVIGFDDAPISQQIHPLLTTVVQPIDEMGRASVDKLVHLINNPMAEIEHIEIPTRLVLRNSCAVSPPH